MNLRDGGKVDTARPTTMPWCPSKYTAESWPVTKFKAKMREYHDFTAWADAAEHLCEHREDPSWVKQATYLVQTWMNAKEINQADAEKEIRAAIAQVAQERSPAGQASAEEQRFAFSGQALEELKPVDDVAKAVINGKPAWCDQVGKFEVADRWDTNRIVRSVDHPNGLDGTIAGAFHICQRPTDPTWKTYAAVILQKWMNWTHLSQADAEKSLRARIQVARFAGQRDELCKALKVDGELAGEAKTYADARLQLLGCTNENQALWQDPGRLNQGGILFYLDGDTQVDDLMRLYWLFAYVDSPSGGSPIPSSNASENGRILYYAVAQNDFARLDTQAIDKTLSAAPYNEYARTVILETLGVLKRRQRAYEKIVDKLAKGDEDYTAILRTAPRKALAEWDKLAAQWKPEIERSNAFEKLLSQPSRKTLKGCAPQLTKDAEKVVKSLKITAYKDLVDKVAADPVANLLFSRLALCDAADKVYGASGALNDLVSHGRSLRGPRSLTYYAIVDAIAEARKDRPRLMFDLNGFLLSGGAIGTDTNFDARDFDLTGHAPSEWEKSDNKGVVASTKKLDDGIQVVFKTVKLKWPNYDCVDDVHHPLRINSDGRIEYFQHCKATGTVTVQDATPHPIVIHPLLDAGVKPGAFVQFIEAGPRAKNGNSFGAIVYVKKSSDDKKISTFFGFAL